MEWFKLQEGKCKSVLVSEAGNEKLNSVTLVKVLQKQLVWRGLLSDIRMYFETSSCIRNLFSETK